MNGYTRVRFEKQQSLLDDIIHEVEQACDKARDEVWDFEMWENPNDKQMDFLATYNNMTERIADILKSNRHLFE